MIIVFGVFTIVQASAICIGFVRGKEDGLEQTSSYFREIMLNRQMAYKFSRIALPFGSSRLKISETMKTLSNSKRLIK